MAAHLPKWKPADRTQGFLWDANGKQLTNPSLTVGEDQRLRSGRVPAARAGLRSEWFPAREFHDHAEAHAAAILRHPGAPQEANLVLNNTPCRSRGIYKGCNDMLPGMLPANKRLHVYLTDGEHTWWYATYDGTGEGVVE
jgi:Double-stranded DNA deaminase toxin A